MNKNSKYGNHTQSQKSLDFPWSTITIAGNKFSILLWNARNKISKMLGTFKNMQASFNMQLCPADCQKTKDVPLLTGG